MLLYLTAVRSRLLTIAFQCGDVYVVCTQENNFSANLRHQNEAPHWDLGDAFH